MRGEGFADLLMGRTTADTVVDVHGTEIIQRNELITKDVLKLIVDAEVDTVKVRSPLTCSTVSGVCQKCFGMDLSTRKQVEIGSPIGVISSQSIGEPGTQLTMRTFHS